MIFQGLTKKRQNEEIDRGYNDNYVSQIEQVWDEIAMLARLFPSL